jgi:HAAS domain-containing protein
VLRSEPVTDYLAALARDLGYDPALSRRVCSEVEDHLWQAAELSGGRSVENQLQAIRSFGEPREVARGYLTTSLSTQIRCAGAAMILAAAAIYLAMKARVAWYDWVNWGPNSDFRAVSAIALQIDRYANMLAIIAAILACAYIATRRVPARINASYRRQLNRCIVLCSASACALSVCVTADMALMVVRLSGVPWSTAAMIPILSLVVEIAAIFGLVFSIHRTIRRQAIAASLIHE